MHFSYLLACAVVPLPGNVFNNLGLVQVSQQMEELLMDQ